MMKKESHYEFETEISSRVRTLREWNLFIPR